MSYFSTALNRVAERNALKQADVVRRSGLKRSHVSRLFTGTQTTVYDADMAAILRVFGGNPLEQAELIAARCKDVRSGPGAELVEITVRNRNESEHLERDVESVDLSQETERAFAWLRSQCPINPDLEKHLVGYARLTGMK